MSRTWNYNQKILQVSYFLPIYSFMGLESTQTAAGHAKVDKKFSIFRFQGKSLPKPPRNLKYGEKCLFLALRRLFCKMRLWESKWGNTNVLPPYLLRLNFPNLEGIEIEVICDDFWGPLKLDVQKMAKIPFQGHCRGNPYRNENFLKKKICFSKKSVLDTRYQNFILTPPPQGIVWTFQISEE